MSTLQWLIFGLCTLLAISSCWVTILYILVLPNKTKKYNETIAHHKAQADYYHEMALKSNELNINLQKRITEYLDIERKKSIDAFQRKVIEENDKKRKEKGGGS